VTFLDLLLATGDKFGNREGNKGSQRPEASPPPAAVPADRTLKT